ncbi:hypothetical protein [Pseudonocardia sp. 73-21]|nr:hypothetical protein [Pseudonocardia sp. 73-21]
MPHVENYTVGVRPMDWSAAMDRTLIAAFDSRAEAEESIRRASR